MSELHPRDRLAYWHDVANKVFVKHECRVEKLPTFDATIHTATLGELDVVDVDSHRLALCCGQCAKHQERRGRRLLAWPAARRKRDYGPGRARGDPPAGRLHAARCAAAVFCPLLGEMATALHQDPASRAQGAPGAEFATHRSRDATWVGHQRARLRLPAHDPTTHRRAAGAGRRRGSPSRFSISPPLHLGAEGGRGRPALSSARATALLRLRSEIERRLPDPALNPETAAAAAGISVRYANALLAERRSVARAADRFATSRALPSRFGRRQTSAPHDRRYCILLGLLRPFALHAPLQGRLRLYPYRLPPAAERRDRLLD